MNKLQCNILYEYNYLKYMKIFVLLFFLLVGVFVLNQNNLINKFYSLNQRFQSTIVEAEQNGEDVEKLLKEESKTKEIIQDDGRVLLEIDNILRYDYEQLQTQYQKIQPNYAFVEVLSSSALVFLPIIAGVFAIYVATYDFSGNTLKIRLLSGDSNAVYFSKLIASIGMFTFAFVLAVLCGYIISAVWSYFVHLNSPVVFDVIYPFSDVLKSLIASFAVTYFISVCFLFIGFGLGFLTKRFSLSLFIFLLYHLLIPNLGTYDLKNLIINVYASVFSSESVAIFININLVLAWLLIVGFVLIFLLSGYIRFNKMSKYTI